MTLKIADIQNRVNQLKTYLEFKADPLTFSRNKRKILVVEGKTDERFMKKYICEDVACITVSQLFTPLSHKSIYGGNSISNKIVIIELINGLTKYQHFINLPPNLKKWKICGMIDKDFDEQSQIEGLSLLFITDTHDLETLMLSTDETLLQRVGSCQISSDEATTSLFLAYQLSHMRLLLKTFRKKFPNYDDITHFSECVTDDYKISFSKFLHSFCDDISTNEVKKMILDKKIRKVLAKDGIWASDLDNFKIDKIDNFWNQVNGHDILMCLRFINKNAALFFPNGNRYSLNRNFEMALIDEYRSENFKHTNLSSQMKEEQII